MSNLLTREKAERLFKNWATVGVMGEVAALLLARADGTLQTRQEFIDNLNIEAADDVLAEWEAHLVGQQPNPFTTGTQWTAQRIVFAALGDSDD